MKMVVLDGYTTSPGDLDWSDFEKIGELKVYDRTTFNVNEEQKVIDNIGDAEVIFTNKTPITKSILESAPNVKYIGVLATGYNVVDIETAKEKGIVVTNIPTYGTSAVSQMTFALLLEMCHHVGAHSDDVKKGTWSNNLDWCYWNYPLMELEGKKMGIIGFGKIGQAVAKLAVAFGMKVLAFDKNRNQKLEDDDIKYVEFDELLSQSDVISLHCPLFESTRGIICKSSINKMKDGVMIINTARGPLIVEQDLADSLNSGKVSGAALDVVSVEPIEIDNPLLTAKNSIITPHISWAPIESRKRLMDIAVNNLRSFVEGNPINVINK
ncbi:D-2-hydroxyacid dehydrogenase [Aquibacillus sediminis]|uniref:D-2-hydroxyacid dehydrogenase n=1 Tax=Aquibacillus sediminis TaxID=2574734 RepID=UPI001109127D|nr:D-2-hydroxyacid dehydrogenase [Aquibacillus sediminis]